MAKHEIVIHENTGATKESAPYLGSYIAKETINESGFREAIAAKSGLSAIQAIAILDGAFEAWEAMEKESLVRINTDLGVICGVITGSFPTADAAFDPERNSLELALRLDDEIKLDLVDVTPTIVTDATTTKLRLDDCVDTESARPYNVVYGQRRFRLQGFNMVTTDEGAAIYLQNSLGTTFPVVIDEVVSKQLLIVHTAALLEGGDYKVIVKSRAGDAAGPLQVAFRKVKYLKWTPPVTNPVTVTSTECGTFGDGKISLVKGEGGVYADLVLNGTHLKKVSGDAGEYVKLIVPGTDGSEIELTENTNYCYMEESDTKTHVSLMLIPDTVDTSAGKNAKVVLRLKGGDAEGPYQVVEVPLVTA